MRKKILALSTTFVMLMSSTIFAMPGDINGDGDIKHDDAKMLLQEIIKGNASEFLEDGDVNRDGKVNTKDVAMILQKSLVPSYEFVTVNPENTTEPTTAATTVEATTEATTAEVTTEAPTEGTTAEVTTEAPTEGTTVAPTEAPTEATTVAPTEAPTEGTTEAVTLAIGEAETVEGTDLSYTFIEAENSWLIADTNGSLTATLTLPITDKVSKGKVTISGAVTPTAPKSFPNTWELVRITGKDADGKIASIAGLSTDTPNRTLSLRNAEGFGADGKEIRKYVTTGIPAVSGTKYEYTFVIDLDAKTTSLSVNGGTTVTSTFVGDLTLDSIVSVTAGTAADRTVKLSVPTVAIGGAAAPAPSTEASTEVSTEVSSEAGSEASTENPSGGAVYNHNFTTDNLTSSFFTFSTATATNRGPVQYNGITLERSLKMNGDGFVEFTNQKTGKLVLVFSSADGSNGTRRIALDDGENITIPANAIVEITDIDPGSHRLVRTNGESALFYISFVEN